MLDQVSPTKSVPDGDDDEDLEGWIVSRLAKAQCWVVLRVRREIPRELLTEQKDRGRLL